MTKPTYKELEEENKLFNIGLIIVLIISLIISFLATDLEEENKLLNSQLEECKNPQEVWTLKYKCDWGETQYTASYNVTSYEKYLKQVEFMKQLTSCEEIK